MIMFNILLQSSVLLLYWNCYLDAVVSADQHYLLDNEQDCYIEPNSSDDKKGWDKI